MELQRFCQTCHNSANAPHFHGKRSRNRCCGALQDSTLWCGHKSAVLLVGEKRRE